MVAGGGIEGLKLAAELRPDAITLDVMMPDMDGWSVLTALKANPDLADIPVIMLSMVADKHMGFTLGAADCLTKPIKREQIAAVLGKYRRETGGAHVLVVDDDPDVRSVMRAFLEKEGCVVAEAGNGLMALEQVAKSRPTLVLLDLTMPEMDGFEFLIKLRETKEYEDIPVVVITGAGLTEEERKRLDGYAQQILQKGRFDGEGLFSNLQGLIHRINKKPASEAEHTG
jgi:CheY-like chemotaxis protein